MLTGSRMSSSSPASRKVPRKLRKSMERTRYEVGAVRVDRVVEFEQPLLSPLDIYPEASAADIAAQMSWLAPRFYDPEKKLLVAPIQGFAVRVGGKVMVVDTCGGDCKARERPHFNQQRRDWIGKLAAIGVAPEKVD